MNLKRDILLACLLVSLPVLSQRLNWVPFEWTRNQVSGRILEKAAIRVPVTLDGVPHRFTMQLDLGAVHTSFSGNAIDPYLEAYPSLHQKLDTTRTFRSGTRSGSVLNGVELCLGDVCFEGLDVGYLKGYGRPLSKDSIHLKKGVRIGTLGADLFQDKVLIIDYRKQRIAIADSIPSLYRNVPLEPFRQRRGRIQLPFRINGRAEWLLFDTGASIFALTTTKERALALSDSLIVDSLTVPSWGRYVTFQGMEVSKLVEIDGKHLKPALVYYEVNRYYDAFYESEGVWGLMGNAYFLDHILIIDYTRSLFGIK